jgi:hypothetical protein
VDLRRTYEVTSSPPRPALAPAFVLPQWEFYHRFFSQSLQKIGRRAHGYPRYYVFELSTGAKIRKIEYHFWTIFFTFFSRRGHVFSELKVVLGIKSDSHKLFINLTLLGHVTENFNSKTQP